MIDFIKDTHNNIIHMPRSSKRLLMMLLDSIFLPVCLWASYALRLSNWWPDFYLKAHWWLFVVVPLVGVFIFSRTRIYRTILRYIGSKAVLQIVKAVALLSLVLLIIGYNVSGPTVPRSVPIIFGLVALLYVAATRFFYRHYYHWILQRISKNEAIAIYGAGAVGVKIAAAMSDSDLYRAVVFIDDDPHLTGSVVQGLRVYSPNELKKIVPKYQLTGALLAMPSAAREHRLNAVEKLTASKLKVLTVPALSEIKAGGAQEGQLRVVQIEDLLGRDPVPPRSELFNLSVKDQTVLVTGAGGSIGSELCRKILSIGPKKLILFDSNEFNLYQIEQELTERMQEEGRRIEVHPVLGSVTDRARFEATVYEYSVDTLYHAAAYKHVPLVEQNVLVGIENNIFGTRVVCEAAKKSGVKRFILVSSDKAVRPTNVMGATKRFAELIVQDMASRKTKTIFSMVRFGNVLGSSGSVVPLFKRQIAQGGPLTVTHRDVSRYFMTISEAASLVIQAGSLAEGGEVFVLDMGREVNIYDLACQMILLSGLTVRDENDADGSIEIKFSGLRPAEKMHEELLIGREFLETEHPRINKALEENLAVEIINQHLLALEKACENNDAPGVLQILASAGLGYEPAGILFDCLSSEKEASKKRQNAV